MTNEQYLLMAYKKATESPDPSTQNGAVIVNNSGISVSACNTFPKRVRTTAERLVRPLKYHYIEHAERGAVYEAAKLGVSTQGGVMYVPWFACVSCARSIACAGIRKVVGHKKMLDGTPERWKEEVDIGVGILQEAGVSMIWLTGDLDGPKILFNGEWFYP